MSYLKAKLKRMRTKYCNILRKDLGIEISDSSTNVLVVCNGGLSSGITYELVCTTFEKFGPLEKVIMIPGKCYCFVKFNNESAASEAFNAINKKLIWSQMRNPVILEFVTDINSLPTVGSYNLNHPPGLILIENFISEKEEELLLNLVGFDSTKDNNTSELKHRKVKHYGYEFKYSTNNVHLSEPIQQIPQELNYIWERLKEHGCNLNFIPDQLTVNCYDPGQGIPPHVDTHSAFEDGILSLSLESTVVMDFRKEKDIICNVILPRRSLCVMLGESRYDWTHGITPRKSDVILNSVGSLTVQSRGKRTSLTFRKTRKGECLCKFPRLCDSYIKNLQKENVSKMKSIILKDEVSSKLEENYVHEVYEKIATHFSETRHKPWPNVMKFVNSFETGSILVDIGCGNGKYFTKQSIRFEIGCDFSSGLLQFCKNQKFECFSCNCLFLPLKNDVADGCICIAVIHHLTTDERRKKAVREITRILRSKGKALIYVWAKNQEKENNKSSYLKQKTKKEKKIAEGYCEHQMVSINFDQEELVIPVHVNKTNFSHNDLLVPWKLKPINSGSGSPDTGQVHLRYYHVFEDNELKKMCEEMEQINILDYYYDQGNWCIIIEKK